MKFSFCARDFSKKTISVLSLAILVKVALGAMVLAHLNISRVCFLMLCMNVDLFTLGNQPQELTNFDNRKLLSDSTFLSNYKTTGKEKLRPFSRLRCSVQIPCTLLNTLEELQISVAQVQDFPDKQALHPALSRASAPDNMIPHQTTTFGSSFLAIVKWEKPL